MKIVAIYDNNKTVDRYTFVTDEPTGHDCYMSLGLGGDVEQWGEATHGNHLGKKIGINEVPQNIAEKALKIILWNRR